ncbi:hypothetical protein TRAPUB_2085 [Trametes pubescens]|uniref:Uncharacterized protein n=1 Tax=Trametes pubescens TaxID=154538 RepID=A0A1M2VHQ8_TRAPU|nr:hypothetical protein TRAPUB_2085 [Trametes pubescens]
MSILLVYPKTVFVDQSAFYRSVDGIRTTNSSGKPVLALLILAYWTQTTEPALLKRE